MSYNVYFEYGSVHFLISFKDVAEGDVDQVVLIKEPTKLTHVEIRDLLDTDEKIDLILLHYTQKHGKLA